MPRLTCLLLPALALLLTAGCHAPRQADAPTTVQPLTCGSIRTIHRVGGLYLASQPSAEDYAQLRDRGVKTVIDLRLEQEQRGFDEQAVVTSLGMTYLGLPWNGPDQLTDAKLDAMRAALRTAERPIVMKCGSSNRVAAGWLAYRVLDEGIAVEQALAEAKTVGLRTPAYEQRTLQYIHAR